MKHHEFYIKCKTNYPPLDNSIFSKRNWWLILLVTVMAVLVEPLVIMYKHQRPGLFSMSYYLQLAAYLLIMVTPFVAFLYWINWREMTKRSRGYGWVGKFEVIGKRSSLAFHYLLLEPDSSNKVKVNHALFEKIRIGDCIQIRRDAFGSIEEINKISNFTSRISRAEAKRSAERS